MPTLSNASKIRLYFFASGAIALHVLEQLVSANQFELVGCATQPDSHAGRAHRLTQTPISKYCKEKEIIVDQPKSVNDESYLAKLHALALDIILVFSFGQLLKETLLKIPRLGCINIHASLLPRYRGASPIAAALLSGDTETGISYMQMEKGLDSGPVFKQYKMVIPSPCYAQELESRLSQLAGDTVIPTLAEIVSNEIIAQKQDPTKVSVAPKIRKENGQVSWLKNAFFIERMVRAYHPWPGAWFIHTGKSSPRRITITAAMAEEETAETRSSTAGSIIQADKNGIKIKCSPHVLKIEKLLPEGKREMSSSDFLHGNQLTIGKSI